jgi:hypothetical protein
VEATEIDMKNAKTTKRKRLKQSKPVTDLRELRELDAFISAHGGLAPLRGHGGALRSAPAQPGTTTAP